MARRKPEVINTRPASDFEPDKWRQPRVRMNVVKLLGFLDVNLAHFKTGQVLSGKDSANDAVTRKTGILR